jgi:putative transposase
MLWGVRELAELSTEARELALESFRLLVPHLEGKRTLRSVALEAGVPFRTAQRWVERYRKSALAALARKGRTDDGGRRVYSQRIFEAIEGLALERPPLPITAIYRQVKLGYWGATEQKTRLRIQVTSTIEPDGLRAVVTGEWQ